MPSWRSAFPSGATSSWRGASSRAQLDITIQEALSRVRYVEQLARTAEDGYAVRDEGMADNLVSCSIAGSPGER